MGLVGKRTGSIRINGTESIKLAPHKIARLGVGYCPEERGIFASLSAEENLMLPPAIAKGGSTLRDYVGSDGASGYFQLEYFVYGRAKEACRVCGHSIRQTRIGQRSSFHCAVCQRG